MRHVIKNFWRITFSDSYKNVSYKSTAKENVCLEVMLKEAMPNWHLITIMIKSYSVRKHTGCHFILRASLAMIFNSVFRLVFLCLKTYLSVFKLKNIFKCFYDKKAFINIFKNAFET